MSTTKKLLISAGVLVALGLLLFVIALTVGGWDFTNLNTGKFETNTYTIEEDFDSISIHTQTADVVFLPSEDGACRVVCYEEQNLKHTVAVEDGTLFVNAVDTRKWYDHIGIFLSSPKITLYLPKEAYSSLKIEGDTGDTEIPADFSLETVDISVSTGDVKCYAATLGTVKITASTGKILLEGGSAASLDLCTSTGDVTVSDVSCSGSTSVKVSTGKTNLKNLTCASLTTKGSTGDISLIGVVVSGKMSVERSTGDVYLEHSDGGEIFISVDTGDVRGSLLTEKVFFADSDTGTVSVPQSTLGGRCEITASTGDIKITID